MKARSAVGWLLRSAFTLSSAACSLDGAAGEVGVYEPPRNSPAQDSPGAPPTSPPLPSIAPAPLAPIGAIATAAAPAPADATAPAVLPPIVAPTGPTFALRNWIAIGGDLDQSFARPDAPMGQADLGTTHVLWDMASWGPATGTPVVYDASIYFSDWRVGMHAVSLGGSELWKAAIPSGVASTPFVTEDAVYVMSRDPFVLALDRKTGELRWRTRISDKSLARLWGSPMVADGVVVVGLGALRPASQDNKITEANLIAFRGAVIGLDAVTGDVRWRFETTRGPDGTRYGPGAASRSTAAIDSVRKIAYIGTSNSLRPPASRYSDALLALDYTTSDPRGRLLWAYQFTPDDNFTEYNPQGPDADVAATPNLVSLNGRDCVAVGDKTGTFYLLDRASGGLIWKAVVSNGTHAGGVLSGAAYADGVFYITSNQKGATRLLALAAQDGTPLWTTEIPSALSYMSPLLLKDMVLLTPSADSSNPDARSRLVAYRRDDGEDTGWTLPLPTRQAGGISLYGTSIFISYGFSLDNDPTQTNLHGGLLRLTPDDMAVH